ncbi:MAG: hypothetical protein H0W09_08070 [Solirubrobacterales bacterium]|nr:hypothetical protein [Solirubrobacterales bacterium]
MWLMTLQGYYSVVADRDRPDKLLVRARTREDIEALRRQIPELEPWEDRSADYRWRASVSRAQLIVAMTLLIDEIDYPNFKSAVAERGDHERANLYSRLWGQLLSLQR